MSASESDGTVRPLWRVPVMSMLGEELDAADFGEGGIVDDHAYALVDGGMGKVASVEQLKLRPNMFACGAPSSNRRA